MMPLPLIAQVLAIHLKRKLAYRVDFWITFWVTIIGGVGLAYFLWKAIFEARGVDQINGFTFPALLYYYGCSTSFQRVIQGMNWGFLSQDIYQGHLNKYLLYPLPVVGMKYLENLAEVLPALLQFIFLAFFTFILWPIPSEFHISLSSIALGLIALLLSFTLFYAMSLCIEQIAFWADNVWSLSVLLNFGVGFLGGAWIPFPMFPQSMQKILAYSPTTYTMAFPVHLFLGLDFPFDWQLGITVCLVWIIIFFFLARVIWQRGNLRYTGVGI